MILIATSTRSVKTNGENRQVEGKVLERLQNKDGIQTGWRGKAVALMIECNIKSSSVGLFASMKVPGQFSAFLSKTSLACMFCLLISGTKEIPSFIFWKLYVHMHVNKTKFERNSSLEY